MRPGSPPRRRKGLPPRRSEPRKRLHVVQEPPDWKALTEALWERCDGTCEASGLPLPAEWSAWDRHHRQTREYGDDTLPNLVAVRSDWHVLTSYSIHMRPQWARERGLIVPSWSNPKTAGLWLPDGRLVRLTEDGPYEVIMEGEPRG